MSLSGTENDILLPAVVLVLALLGLFRFAFGPKASGRSRSRGYSYRAHNFEAELGNGAGHTGNFQIEQNGAVQHFGQQLQSVMISSFEKRRIMNTSEYRAFRIIEEDIVSIDKGYRIFAQTCLGEVLQSKDDEAFRSINSKRVDFLIVDRGGWPVLAVEYQGEGHFKGTAAARDAIKKEALRKAGVRYLEITPDDSSEQICRHVREHLGLDAPGSPTPASPTPTPPPSSPRTGFGLRTAAH